MSFITPEAFMKFFEENMGVKFVDMDTGKSALEVIAQKKEESEKSDYDVWLEQQDESVRLEHQTGEF